MSFLDRPLVEKVVPACVWEAFCYGGEMHKRNIFVIERTSFFFPREVSAMITLFKCRFTTSFTEVDVNICLYILNVWSLWLFFSQKPDLDKVNGPLKRYYLSCKELGAGRRATFARVTAPSTSYIIQNLKIWTTYQIRIAICNGVFCGPWSSIRSIKTKQDG